MGIVLVVGGALSHEVYKYKGQDAARAEQFGAGVTAMLYIYTAIYGSTWLTTW